MSDQCLTSVRPADGTALCTACIHWRPAASTGRRRASRGSAMSADSAQIPADDGTAGGLQAASRPDGKPQLPPDPCLPIAPWHCGAVSLRSSSSPASDKPKAHWQMPSEAHLGGRCGGGGRAAAGAGSRAGLRAKRSSTAAGGGWDGCCGAAAERRVVLGGRRCWAQSAAQRAQQLCMAAEGDAADSVSILVRRLARPLPRPTPSPPVPA